MVISVNGFHLFALKMEGSWHNRFCQQCKSFWKSNCNAKPETSHHDYSCCCGLSGVHFKRITSKLWFHSSHDPVLDRQHESWWDQTCQWVQFQYLDWTYRIVLKFETTYLNIIFLILILHLSTITTSFAISLLNCFKPGTDQWLTCVAMMQWDCL